MIEDDLDRMRINRSQIPANADFTDSEHIVTSEGFMLSELDEKIVQAGDGK